MVSFPEGWQLGCRAYPADGPIQAGLAHNAALTKTSIGAYTLGAPKHAGIRLTVVSRTAYVHVVTAPGLIDDGTAGGSKSTLTFGGFPGASITLLALDGRWNLVRKNVVAIT